MSNKYKVAVKTSDNIYSEKISSALYNKLKIEYDMFLDNLKTLSPDEIIKHSYETVFKEEILTCFENGKPLNDRQSKALLSTNNSLDYLYNEWLDTDCSYLDSVLDSIRESANKEIKYGKNHTLTEKETR